MSSKKHIQDELNGLKSSLSFDNNQPFSVPDGYFEGLAASVLAKVKSSNDSVQMELEELSPLLAGIPNITPYSVPLLYFEQNLEVFLEFSVDPNLSFLNSIGKELPYKTPQGYFEKLSEEIIAKVLPRKAKVVPMFARKWMRMAVAAVVGGIIAVSGYQYFGNSRTVTPDRSSASQNQVASAPIIAQEIKKVSTRDLENFIETVDVNATKKKEDTKTSAKTEVKELVKDVSAADMENFLSQLPASDEDLGATN